jgi:cytochrome P450
MTACATRPLESWKPGELIDLHEAMMHLTLQVVGKTLFNADVARDAPQVGETLHIVLEFASDFRHYNFRYRANRMISDAGLS